MEHSEQTVRNVKFQVYVGEDGTFFANYKNEQFKAESMNDLKAKLDNAVRKSGITLNLEFWRYQDGKMVRGVVYGMHSSNGNLMVAINGTKVQEGGWRSAGYFLIPDAAERVRYAELMKEQERIEKEIKKFEAKHQYPNGGIKKTAELELDAGKL